MSEFKNVTIVKKANVYFDGKVTSRTIKFEDGSVKTLGFMQVGDYVFSTNEAEIMEIFSGELDVMIPNSREPRLVKGGESFNVPANTSFSVYVRTPVDYCCSFIK